MDKIIPLSIIDECSIAKIESNEPFIATYQSHLKKTSYEWFYFEIKQNNSHIVLILSLKDSFHVGAQEQCPSSIYLTWHLKDKLIAYSYSIYKKEDFKSMEESLYKFLTDKSENFELLIPDFSTNKYIYLKMKFNKEIHSSQNKIQLDKSNKEHFWQFLLSENSISGSIETIYAPKKIANKEYLVLSGFHDALLKNKLKKNQSYKLYFENAHVYMDHNFGFSPLYTIKDRWCWWHTEGDNDWEVNYFFPKIKKSFYVSNFDNKISSLINQNITHILSYKANLFLYFYPKRIISNIFGNINFNKIIESAPFYLRAKLDGGKLSSTIEYLIPKRISNPLNRILMSARKIKVNKVIQNKSCLENFLSFEDICLKITKNNGKSFYFSSLVMPKKERIKSYLVYTICRIIDDATDEFKKDENELLSGSSFSKILLNMLWDTDAVLNSDFVSKLKQKLSFCLSFEIDMNSTINFINKIKIEIYNLKLDKKHFDELILGQNMDENFSQPKNFDELYLYCFRVAGVVGLMMAKIFGVKSDKKALEAAEHLGIAMQITNILRDIKEDFYINRIYLPQDICLKNNVQINYDCFSNFETLSQQKVNLVKELSLKSVDYYQSALNGIPYISKLRYRFCVRLMCAIYSAILSKILKKELVVFKERVVVSKAEKFIIFLKVLLGFNPLYAAGIKYK